MKIVPRLPDALKHGVLRVHQWLLPPSACLGWMPYLWLPYSAFLFVGWLARPPGVTEMLSTLAAWCVLVVLYFRGYRSLSTRNIGFVVAAMLALALILLPVNAGASVIVIYAAAFAGTFAPRGRALFALILVVTVPQVEAGFMDLSVWVWGPALFMGLLVGLSNIHFSEVRRKDAALHRSHEEIGQLAARAERERIARDLHDLLGHTLSVIALKAELAGKLMGRDRPAAGSEIRDVERIAREALQEVRSAVQGYRAGSLQAELARARTACAAAGVAFEEDVACECDPAESTVLAPVLREAMTNLVRHAHARRATLTLSRRQGGVCLSVADDGRGGPLQEGNGISGMRERLAAAGGRLEVSSDARGTRVAAFLPAGRHPPVLAEDAAA